MLHVEKKHRLLILGSLEEFVVLVSTAKSRGYYTVVCDGYVNGVAKKIADRAYTIDIRDTDEIIALCRKEQIDGIITSFSDILFEQATRIAEAASLRWYVTTSMLPCYRNKYIMKDLLHRVNIATSTGKVISECYSDTELDDLHFPLVIKPLDSYGSRGVYVLRSLEEVRTHFAAAAAYSTDHRVLLEEFCAGREYNIMTWVCNGKVRVISIADREKNPLNKDEIPPLNRLVYPAKYSRQVVKKAEDALQRFVDEIGQQDGPLSMQFFFVNGQVIVGEIAGRFFGYEHELVTYCSGFSFEDLLLDYVYSPDRIESRLKDHDPSFSRYCAGIYFQGIDGKIIADDTALRKLTTDHHVLEYSLYYSPGEVVDHTSGKPYFARFDLTAPSREELDCTTKDFFLKAHVKASDGSEVLLPFILQQDNSND